MPGALEGIKIVDLTNIILGPYGTMLLADQGAEVIKVEAPEGDAVRHIGKPGKSPGMGPTYLYVNRNKRSLCLDLKDKAARAALLKVVATADAFVHALRPQAIEGLGLGYEDIRKVNPNIVYVGAYGYSADGPYGKLPAYDDAIQARFGIADLMGRAAGDDVPRYPPTILADKTVGLTFAFSTLSALMHRQRTGEGQFVEVPMFETMAAWLMVEHLWERTFSDEGEVGYTRLLSRSRKPYRTLDGWMAILPYNDKHWRNFFEIVGRPEVLKDPRYSTLNARSMHISDMYAMVEALAPSRTTAEWVKLLDEGQAGENVGLLLRGIKREDVERGQVCCKPGSITPHTEFEAQVYILSKDEGGRHTPFFNNYRPQFYFRTTDVTGVVYLPEGKEMVMPGDNTDMRVELIQSIAMEDGLRFAIREGGRTVGAGRVTKILK